MLPITKFVLRKLKNNESNNQGPDSTNQAIDKYVRHKMVRKVATYIVVALLFVAFMGYALYKEHF